MLYATLLHTLRIQLKSITFITFAMYKRKQEVNQKKVIKLYYIVYIYYNILLYSKLRI